MFGSETQWSATTSVLLIDKHTSPQPECHIPRVHLNALGNHVVCMVGKSHCVRLTAPTEFEVDIPALIEVKRALAPGIVADDTAHDLILWSDGCPGDSLPLQDSSTRWTRRMHTRPGQLRTINPLPTDIAIV